MRTLNIIGPGRVGRTLGALWMRAGVFAIGGVLSRTAGGARAATAFIGSGHAVPAMRDMTPAEVWMLATPDDRIAESASALGATGLLRTGDVVFHCSGALSSEVLQAAAACGARAASVHPVKSFAEPANAVKTFAGTWCAAEGDARALAILQPAFERIGARVTRIDAASKLLYHAANVIASNYLVALAETALRCYERAGMAREDARAMMAPLMRETVDNVLRIGTVKALTGPIARGDVALIARQIETLEHADPAIAALYRELGAIAVQLAREEHQAGAAALAAIRELLERRA